MIRKWNISKSIMESEFGQMTQGQYEFALRSANADITYHYSNPTMRDFIRVFGIALNMCKEQRLVG